MLSKCLLVTAIIAVGLSAYLACGDITPLPYFEIIVFDHYTTISGEILTGGCVADYRQKAAEKSLFMKDKVNNLLSTDDLCPEADVTVDLTTSSFTSVESNGTMQVSFFLLMSETSCLPEVDICFHEIWDYLLIKEHWEPPVLTQPPTCPAITFGLNDFYPLDDSGKWVCVETLGYGEEL